MKKIFSILAASMLAMSMRAGELTVADGTATNPSLPLCSYYFDYGFQGQMLYDAEELGEMVGASITSLTFFSSTQAQTWGTGTVSVKLAEVEETALSALLTPSFTEVFNGTCSIEGGELTFAFATPFVYSGEKNLLVEIAWGNKGTASSGDVLFYGKEVAGAGYSTRIKQGTYTYSNGVADFLPKTTFVYEGGAVVNCPRPTKLAVTATTADGAVFAWQAEAGAQHQVCVVEKDSVAAGWTLLEADVLTYTATGLSAGTTYDFYVRTYCSESEQSTEVKTSFIPECKAPAAIELSDLTHAAATFSWEAVAGIEKYQFVCVLPDSTPTWAGVEAKAVLTVTVDTLQASTSYDFYVRSYFSAETQSAATKLTFTTNCVAEDMPYAETFASSDKPACWTIENWGSSYNNWSIDTYNNHGTDDSYSLKYNARTSSSSEITTASVNLAEDALLDFYYQNRYGSNGSAVKFEVVVLDASNDAELLTESVTAASPDDEWAQKTIDLSDVTGKIVKLKFVAHGNGGGTTAYLRIDDLSVTAKPCTTPTRLDAAASTTGAVVTWAAGGSEAAWNLRYKAVSAEEWTLVNDIDEPTYTLSALAQETEYEVQVQAACNGDKQSEWTASATFTPVCPTPSELAVKIVDADRAIVAWECTENAFNLQYKAAEAEEWTTVESLGAKTYELTDLEASTTYQVRVQTACGSAYTNAVSFTTRCAPLEVAIPHVWDMDSVAVGTLPECWFVLPNTADVSVMLMNDSTHRLYIAGEQECWIVLPTLAAEMTGWTLSVNYSGANLKDIGYMTSADTAAYVSLVEVSTTPAECDLRNLPTEANYLAIHYLGTASYSQLSISSVEITETKSQTAIETINGEKTKGEWTKVVYNGQLIIEHNGVKYNAQGTILK